jgi:hypothetical protein
MKTKNLLSVMAFIAMLLVPSGALANAVVYMQHGTVVIDNAYIRAVSTYSYAYALWSKNDAITTIYSGRFYGECNFLKTVTDAWGVVIDGGKVTIEDGIFQAKSEDGSAWGIRFMETKCLPQISS